MCNIYIIVLINSVTLLVLVLSLINVKDLKKCLEAIFKNNIVQNKVLFLTELLS